jgi:hypothetical protein
MDSVDRERDAGPSGTIASSPDASVKMAEIQRSLDRLDKAFREPFTMHHEGYKYHEIADQLGYPHRHGEEPDLPSTPPIDGNVDRQERSRLKPTAIVIGAGFSGIAAAASLARRGFTVDLVEKNNGAGGRASVWRQNGVHVRHGSEFLLDARSVRTLLRVSKEPQ